MTYLIVASLLLVDCAISTNLFFKDEPLTTQLVIAVFILCYVVSGEVAHLIIGSWFAPVIFYGFSSEILITIFSILLEVGFIVGFISLLVNKSLVPLFKGWTEFNEEGDFFKIPLLKFFWALFVTFIFFKAVLVYVL